MLYQLQCIAISREDCHHITARERSMYKNIFKLNKLVKNKVLYSNLGLILAQLYVKYVGQLLELQNMFLLDKDFFWINGVDYARVLEFLWYPYINNQILVK